PGVPKTKALLLEVTNGLSRDDDGVAAGQRVRQLAEGLCPEEVDGCVQLLLLFEGKGPRFLVEIEVRFPPRGLGGAPLPGLCILPPPPVELRSCGLVHALPLPCLRSFPSERRQECNKFAGGREASFRVVALKERSQPGRLRLELRTKLADQLEGQPSDGF